MQPKTQESMKLGSGMIIPAVILLLAPSIACTQGAPPPINSYLSGVVTVSAKVDSTGDYSGIEVIVTDGVQAGTDTLGYAVTSADGSFSTGITAPEKGVYPLILKRGGSVLSVSEFVVVNGDSASLRAQLPMGKRLPNIRSPENSAWLAFKNAEAQHSDRVMQILKSDDRSQESLKRAIELGAEVLWSVRTSFPGTIGASVASAKSVVMLDGWNDSLLVARLHELDPSQPGFLEGVQAGGRAETRRNGIEAGVALLRSMRSLAGKEEAKAGIQREIAQAYLDANDSTKAVAAIDKLVEEHQGKEWSDWADRAKYQIEHLLRGRQAPSFHLATRLGGDVDLDDLKGRPVVLEFWAPRDRQYAAEIPMIDSLLANDQTGVQWISFGLESDEDLYNAFFEGRDVPGIQVHDADSLMEDLIVRYNVETVPTRYLIDADGRIYDKYLGSSLSNIAADLQEIGNNDE
ncbi:MAG: TlpA disulfide reductase family protein [Rhodothermales bacterium]